MYKFYERGKIKIYDMVLALSPLTACGHRIYKVTVTNLRATACER